MALSGASGVGFPWSVSSSIHPAEPPNILKSPNDLLPFKFIVLSLFYFLDL